MPDAEVVQVVSLELGWRMSLGKLADLVEARLGLTPRLLRRVERDFGPDSDGALGALAAGLVGLPSAERQDQERLAAAVVLPAAGRVGAVQDALALGRADWRDLLVAAGLAGGDWRAVLDRELGPP